MSIEVNSLTAGEGHALNMDIVSLTHGHSCSLKSLVVTCTLAVVMHPPEGQVCRQSAAPHAHADSGQCALLPLSLPACATAAA